MNIFGKNILIISAHPDDDILGCGGFLAKIKNKNLNVKIIFLAEGSSCRYKINDQNKNIIHKTIEDRNRCALKALNYLGIKNVSFFNLKCGSLDTYPILDISKIIENEISKFNPDTIFTHHENDLNNDHKIVFRATLQATRPGALNFVKFLYSYEVISSTEWNFTNCFLPNIFLSISKKEIKMKAKAFSYYQSEIKKYPKARSLDSIEALARYRGFQSGSEYAESFKLIRSLI